MAWITAGEVDLEIGTATRIGIAGSATTSGSAFALFERRARSDVKAYAAIAGYEDLGDTTDNDTLKSLCVAQWYLRASGSRKGMSVPESIKDQLFRLEMLRRGDYSIPGLTPSAQNAIGGSAFSKVGTADASRKRYFSPDNLKGL